MRKKKHLNIIITIIICIFLALPFLLFVIPLESEPITIEFKNFDQHLSWSYFSGGANNQFYTLDNYAFFLEGVLIKGSNWLRNNHIGISISLEANISDVDGIRVDQLEKTKIWEGLAIWDGSWGFESSLIDLSSLQKVFSTGFKFQASLFFSYVLKDSIFSSSIHETTILMDTIEHS